MVSVNPSPVQGFYFFDHMNMGLSSLNSAPPSSTAITGNGPAPSNAAEDPSKKVRKPYTITKSRESWTEQEHDKFLEALQLFDRDWKKIEAFVGSKTVIQIRSHAQKYFLKVQKSGTSEHVPPARPKRKAAHPYPQKAPKVPAASQVNRPFQPASTLYEPGFVVRPDASPSHGNTVASVNFSSWSYNSMAAVNESEANKDDVRKHSSMVAPSNCYNSNIESKQKNLLRSHVIDRENHQSARVIMPDFAKVYKFIGSVFDPNESGHLQRMKQMEPINLETVLLLMRNLCVNLTSPEFEEQRRMLASYNGDADTTTSSSSSSSVKSGGGVLLGGRHGETSGSSPILSQLEVQSS